MYPLQPVSSKNPWCADLHWREMSNAHDSKPDARTQDAVNDAAAYISQYIAKNTSFFAFDCRPHERETNAKALEDPNRGIARLNRWGSARLASISSLNGTDNGDTSLWQMKTCHHTVISSPIWSIFDDTWLLLPDSVRSTPIVTNSVIIHQPLPHWDK